MRSEQNSACSTLHQLNHPVWVLLPNTVLPVVFSDGNPEGPGKEHLLKYRSAMQPPGRSAVCVCSTSISIPKLSRYPTLCIKTCITRLRTGYKKGNKDLNIIQVNAQSRILYQMTHFKESEQ